MPSPGVKFLGGYCRFISRFISGYLLFCSALLLALLVIDAAFPQARVYGRIKDVLFETIRQAAPKP
ncbi:MAG TPA: hypothetical protein VG838_08675 [Opitutaceae bacterium]|nr:hypothetical protein [Opitutaceae bacterium]